MGKFSILKKVKGPIENYTSSPILSNPISSTSHIRLCNCNSQCTNTTVPNLTLMAAASSPRLIWRFNTLPIAKLAPSRTSLIPHSTANHPMPLSLNTGESAISARKLPIVLFDVLDTLVRDPFYEDIPAFFGMSMKELLECKHPAAWIEFEKGLIDEIELARIFFSDGRAVDLEGLKCCMRQGYSYIDGVEELLDDLKQSGYEMHASTNYPVWYEIIEDKLKLSNYLSWTFCSCKMGKRKPESDFYADILKHLKVEPSCCIFVDDRVRNVEAAIDAGLKGIQFKNADLLRKDLANLGVDIQTDK